MEDKKKALSDEELMDVSGGISGYPWDMVSLWSLMDGKSLKSVIAIEM